MKAEITFTGRNGKDPEQVVMAIKEAITPTVGDCLTIGMYLRERCLSRTEDGVDVQGHPFQDYSTKGPYYWNPSGQSGKREGETDRAHATRERRAAKRVYTRLRAGYAVDVHEAARKGKGAAYHDTAPHLSKTGRSICFPGGYKQFKQFLGRMGVDLTGPRAPHMLQAFVVRCGGVEADETLKSVGRNEHTDPANVVTLGIYDPEMAKRASAHQNGDNARVPQRKFIGATDADAQECLNLLAERVRGRMKTG